MRKVDALREFRALYPRSSFVLPSGRLDTVARAEAWNNYTDALCKEGRITPIQYSGWTNPF